MRWIGMLFLLIASNSCSSFKHSKVNNFPVKFFNEEGDLVHRQIEYFSTNGQDEHCFENNVDEKTVITVESKYFKPAIDHFHKRELKVTIKKEAVTTSLHGIPNMKVVLKEIVNPQIEVAECYEGVYGFHTDFWKFYTSFRIAAQK